MMCARQVPLLAVGNHVFISYSRNDEAYLSGLVAHLRSAGLIVWHDSGIDYGDQWVAVIQSHIDSCAAFIVVMSPHGRELEMGAEGDQPGRGCPQADPAPAVGRPTLDAAWNSASIPPSPWPTPILFGEGSAGGSAGPT
jgi:TIR domain